MANIYEQIEVYENNILLNIASFLKRLTGLNVYVKDKPFVKPDGPYLTIRIMSSDDSGGWSQMYAFAGDAYSYLMDNKYQIELMAYRGRPMSLLTYILGALRGAQELKYQYLYSKGVSFLSATDIAQANTVMDGDKTETRARIFLTFNTTMILEDLGTTEIETVSMDITSFRDDKTDPDPLECPLENKYAVPHPYSTLYYKS